jgi:hypothetical protein
MEIIVPATRAEHAPDDYRSDANQVRELAEHPEANDLSPVGILMTLIAVVILAWVIAHLAPGWIFPRSGIFHMGAPL